MQSLLTDILRLIPHRARRKAFKYGVSLFLAAALAVETLPVALWFDTYPAATATDGDTFRALRGRYRIWGIDAPELAQTCKENGRTVSCGEMAKLALQALLNAGDITCATRDVDKYSRDVVMCRGGSVEIGKAMIAQGMAIQESHAEGYYTLQEANARRDRRGIWAMEFIPPHQWRRDN